MRMHWMYSVALLAAGAITATPAFSQTTNSPAKETTAQAKADVASAGAGVDSDPAFMIGLRRIGVMAGEVVQCKPKAERHVTITDSMALANQIALHFGLGAAFNYVGAVGYGAGKPFDKAGCTQAIADWNSIKQKYLNQ